MAWYDGDYQHDELWKNGEGREVTIERRSKDWVTGKDTVQFWHERTAYTMDMEKFEEEFTHVKESHDYIVKYTVDGMREEFDTPREAAKFLLKHCNTKDIGIEEHIYVGEKNHRIGFTLCSYNFWSSWVHGKDMLKEIATGKIPKECASSYTYYGKAGKDGTKQNDVHSV